MSNTFLFVDGSNLYNAQLRLFGFNYYLDFNVFISLLEQKLNLSFQKIYFYASFSPIPPKLSKNLKKSIKNEYLFYKSATKIKKLVFFKGYRSPTSGKEKEVDVKLAVDIVDLAHQDKYQTMYFYSADADFYHALLKAKKLHKNIKIIALSNRIPKRFSFNFHTYVILFAGEKTIKQNIVIEKQKITFIKVPSCKKEVKKNPEMHALRAR